MSTDHEDHLEKSRAEARPAFDAWWASEWDKAFRKKDGSASRGYARAYGVAWLAWLGGWRARERTGG